MAGFRPHWHISQRELAGSTPLASRATATQCVAPWVLAWRTPSCSGSGPSMSPGLTGIVHRRSERRRLRQAHGSCSAALSCFGFASPRSPPSVLGTSLLPPFHISLPPLGVFGKLPSSGLDSNLRSNGGQLAPRGPSPMASSGFLLREARVGVSSTTPPHKQGTVRFGIP